MLKQKVPILYESSKTSDLPSMPPTTRGRKSFRRLVPTSQGPSSGTHQCPPLPLVERSSWTSMNPISLEPVWETREESNRLATMKKNEKLSSRIGRRAKFETQNKGNQWPDKIVLLRFFRRIKKREHGYITTKRLCPWPLLRPLIGRCGAMAWGLKQENRNRNENEVLGLCAKLGQIYRSGQFLSFFLGFFCSSSGKKTL